MGVYYFFREVYKEVSAGKLSQNTTELFDLAPQIQARIAFSPSQLLHLEPALLTSQSLRRRC